MKNLLKVLLPPFVGFSVFFVAIRYSSLYFTLKIDEIGEGNLNSFMAYYRYTLPLLFTVAVLTQLLITVPVWNSLRGKPLVLKIIAIIDFGMVCFLLALGISYPIADIQNGTYHLVKLVAFMMLVQTVYWIINLFILNLLSKDQTSAHSTP